MNKSAAKTLDRGQIVSVRRSDRWSIYRRLQELNIPCACPADGTLRVEVNHALALLLVRSTVHQFTTPRQASVEWLERCWQSPAPQRRYT